MSLAIIYSRAQLGIDAPLVTVEVHLTNGLPGLSIVGLPATAVKESKDRVRSALINSHFDYPLRRITVNLAPADLPKEGGRYDLAIALGILIASGQLPQQALDGYEVIGELALSGEVRPIPGAIPAAIQCTANGRKCLLPHNNAQQAAIVPDARIYATEHLLDCCSHLLGQRPLEVTSVAPQQQGFLTPYADLLDVKGQYQAKRALEIAAAGNHSLLLIGPPGTGKTMLASRLPGLLPSLSLEEQLEVAAIRSVANLESAETNQRPFRSPHHTASGIALVGGGSWPKPGEISLAHRGVLFLDELPEFERKVLDVLREPLESGQICISRASQQVTYPAQFQLVAAMNPCPCGYHGDNSGRCHCSADQIQRYQNRISGPLLDRLDLHIEVPALQRGELTASSSGEASATIAERVMTARQRQLTRRGKTNNQLSSRELETDCQLSKANENLLEHAMTSLRLSARAYHRVLRVARTIADLQQNDEVIKPHLIEALGFRKQDRLRG